MRKALSVIEKLGDDELEELIKEVGKLTIHGIELTNDTKLSELCKEISNDSNIEKELMLEIEGLLCREYAYRKLL